MSAGPCQRIDGRRRSAASNPDTEIRGTERALDKHLNPYPYLSRVSPDLHAGTTNHQCAVAGPGRSISVQLRMLRAAKVEEVAPLGQGRCPEVEILAAGCQL
jgi:hypothetical protein